MAVDLLEMLFRRIEVAVDRHPKFTRVRGAGGEPELCMDRQGCTIKIKVIAKGKRRPEVIWAHGRTPEEATGDLIEGLDYWAEASS